MDILDNGCHIHTSFNSHLTIKRAFSQNDDYTVAHFYMIFSFTYFVDVAQQLMQWTLWRLLSAETSTSHWVLVLEKQSKGSDTLPSEDVRKDEIRSSSPGKWSFNQVWNLRYTMQVASETPATQCSRKHLTLQAGKSKPLNISMVWYCRV